MGRKTGSKKSWISICPFQNAKAKVGNEEKHGVRMGEWRN